MCRLIVGLLVDWFKCGSIWAYVNLSILGVFLVAIREDFFPLIFQLKPLGALRSSPT